MNAQKSFSRMNVVPEDEELTEESLEEAHIEWGNLIFLPFHPTFQILVLFSVIVKTILGPIQSVYPIVYCWDVMERNAYLAFIKYWYWYCCDTIYGIDTFLYIVHRQVTDKAMRREYLPKSAFLLLFDIISLIPVFRLVVTDICPPVLLWPNILAFSEFVIIYRIVEYFSLMTTHSFWSLIFGYTLLMALAINCVSCFWLLLTKHGLCENCKRGIYDWRNFVMHKLNETDEGYTTYVYATVFVFSFAINRDVEEMKPSTMTEFIVISVLVMLGELVTIFVVIPKIFAEAILRLRRICISYPQVGKLVDETKRRNSSPRAYIDVKNYFITMWKKRNGINHLPDIIMDLPRCLRIDIKEDLMWPVFYHSPVLRNSSYPFKRTICELIVPDYKSPGEKLYSGLNSHSHVFYLKTGVVQILSADDGITPIISVTGGTIFGDVSFYVPPYKRKAIVKCLTYCEIFYLNRSDYIRALHKYPEDRRNIIALVKDRIKHARTLYTCKQHVRGLDRSEDEGIAWVKRRWWEISDTINNWKKKISKKDALKYEIPPEEAIYHCAKYIGQLVLCTDMQLQTKSMFANTTFPWILLPNSSFGVIWHRVVTITVFFVLLFYPPNVSSTQPIPPWFRLFQYWTDFIYAADICVALLTAVTWRENLITNFASVMFARCKTLYFLLDVMATIWTEYIVIIIGKSQFYNIVQFNRVIKIYMLFTGENIRWNVNMNPMLMVCFFMLLLEFSCVYLIGYVIYVLDRYIPDMTTSFFFGEYACAPNVPKQLCEPGNNQFLGVAIAWTMEFMFPEILPKTLVDIYFIIVVDYFMYLLFMFCKSQFVAAMYMKYVEVTNFQYFVSNLKKYYQYYKIHHDLLKRLDRYLVCHWKYYKGMDLMHPNMLRSEPFDIYWKVQGEVAEKIIGQSEPFIGADPALIRELAFASKFLILPKNATLFLFSVPCKTVSWVVQGNIKCEFHNEEGELLKVYYGEGYMLSAASVFLNKASLKTYSASTECEILYLGVPEFFKIMKRYPDEWAFLENCINELGPTFEELFQNYLQKHRDYQKKLRDRIFHLGKTKSVILDQVTLSNPNSGSPKDVWEYPESDLMKSWMLFRAIIVVVSIVCAALQGGGGVTVRYSLMMTGAFCDCIAWIDIFIKVSLAYYDERGILISDKMKCVLHYVTRGFIFDIIGALPWIEFFRTVMSDYIDDDSAILSNTFCKFAHLYIVMGYFDYIGDSPTVNVAFIKILKWQVISLLLMFGASHFLIYYCVDYTFGPRANLITTERRNTCWFPKFLDLQPKPTLAQLHILYAESMNLAQNGLMKMNVGKFHIDRNNIAVGLCLFILGIVYWFVTCYSLTLLVLNSRGNTLFHHGVGQLRKFLKAERVENELIDQATAHFTYWWMRTKGINIHNLTNERIGVVLRQDLNYYFFQKTFKALDSLLHGGESLSRQLASFSTQIYVLPSQEIIREHDIISHVYVVHRGKVTISQDGEKIATLTKGCIFGQMLTAENRPVRISAISEDYADLLQIHVKQFQDLIDNKVRGHIARNPQSKDDFMATKKHFVENPYDTIQYILRGRKTIKLPTMALPLEAHPGNWYYMWLLFAWLITPILAVAVSLLLMTLPPRIIPSLWPCFAALDAVHFANFVTEFFTMNLVVINKRCKNTIIGLRRFKGWSVYVDALALLLPMLTYLTNEWKYQLFSLLRLRLLYDFNYHFCRSFKNKAPPVLMHFLVLLLVLHAMSCGWIYSACREDTFPLAVQQINLSRLFIDSDNWVLPSERKGGCARMTLNVDPVTNNTITGFVVPKHWQDDYIVAMAYIILLYTQTGIDTVVAISLSQIHYMFFVNFLTYAINIWILSFGISFIYTRYRELYLYDFNVRNLNTFLRNSGVSPVLLNSVSEYTNQLWRRQRGTWLPELAQQAPLCLREDLFCALYMHHLLTPPLFSQLPTYFVRQLAAKLHRIVIFPGKVVVQAGDIFACIYFIHEGEVEKWYVDKNGENKMMSLLSANGYFGLIPGLFPNVAYQNSFCTRTVVDFVFLRLRDWQDLLNGYPDVKRELYTAAKLMKNHAGR